MFAEDDYVTLSALQHYVFCPRQCALIYTEQLWAENALTTFGKLEHKRVDTAPDSSRGGVLTARGVRLICRELRIQGVADVVEYHDTSQGRRVVPVEYKHGRPASHGADVVQLCAQAFCLEEMHSCSISLAYLYYHGLRHREEIRLDRKLREQTRQAIIDTRELLHNRCLPPAHRRAGCLSCSLYELCLPLPNTVNVLSYNEKNFRDLLDNT